MLGEKGLGEGWKRGREGREQARECVKALWQNLLLHVQLLQKLMKNKIQKIQKLKN